MPVEYLRPGAVRLLQFQILFRKHQRGFAGFILRGLPGSQENRLADIHTVEESCQILRVKVRGFAKNHHLRMVIDRKGFFRELIVKLPIPKSRIRGKHGCQFKAEFSLKHAGFRQVVAGNTVQFFRTAHQRTVIRRAERIPFRHARDRTPLPVGTHKNVIALAQHLEEAVAFCLIILSVHVQVQVVPEDAHD